MCDGFVHANLKGAYRLFSDAECMKYESCLACPNNAVCVRELKDSGVACC